MIFRGLFFEHNAGIGRKSRFLMAPYDFSHLKDIISGEFIKIHQFVMIMIDFFNRNHYIAALRYYRRSNCTVF